MFSLRLFIALILFALPALAGSPARTLVSVNAATTIEGDQIRLGDIARLSGEEGTTTRLKGLSLGYAPAIGAEREIQKSYLLMAIAATGVSEDAYVLQMPARAIVRRAGQTLVAQAVRQAVTDAVLQRLNDPSVAIEIATIDFRETGAVPLGELELKASVGAARNFFSPFIVSVEARIAGKLVRTFPATVKVNATAEVLVAAADLDPNKKLAETDAKLQRIAIDQPIINYLRRPEILANSQLIRPVATGQPLTRDVVTAAYLIKTGDTIRIEARSGRMIIAAIGEARANGRLGDHILVKNKESGISMQATVMAEGVVQIVL